MLLAKRHATTSSVKNALSAQIVAQFQQEGINITEIIKEVHAGDTVANAVKNLVTQMSQKKSSGIQSAPNKIDADS